MTNAVAMTEQELNAANVAWQLEAKFRAIFGAADEPFSLDDTSTAADRIAHALINTEITHSADTCLCSEPYWHRPVESYYPYWEERHQREPEANAVLHLYLKVFGLLQSVRDAVRIQSENPALPSTVRDRAADLAFDFLIEEPDARWITPHA